MDWMGTGGEGEEGDAFQLLDLDAGHAVGEEVHRHPRPDAEFDPLLGRPAVFPMPIS